MRFGGTRTVSGTQSACMIQEPIQHLGAAFRRVAAVRAVPGACKRIQEDGVGADSEGIPGRAWICLSGPIQLGESLGFSGWRMSPR